MAQNLFINIFLIWSIMKGYIIFKYKPHIWENSLGQPDDKGLWKFEVNFKFFGWSYSLIGVATLITGL